MNSNPSEQPKTEPTRLQTAAGIGVGLLFLWIVVYNIGKPWSCQQAQAMLEEARSDARRAGADANLGHITAAREAYQKMRDKCP